MTFSTLWPSWDLSISPKWTNIFQLLLKDVNKSSFLIITKYFLIPLVISSLSHLLFRKVVFNAYISINSPNFFVGLDFQFNFIVIRKHSFYDLSTLHSLSHVSWPHILSFIDVVSLLIGWKIWKIIYKYNPVIMRLLPWFIEYKLWFEVDASF